MAELLKNKYGLVFAEQIARMVTRVDSRFDGPAFIADVSVGYEGMELMQRAHHMAQCMARYLPSDFQEAADVLVKSLGPVLTNPMRNGMAPFVYLPHVFYIARYGLNDVHASLHAQYELTQRFTAEFSIRPFIEKYPVECFNYFERWVHDDSEHVRRLVSEGTRPRLPWAQQLKSLILDPSPSLPLLEQLKDDASDYVRRSVANHLNDIGKDNPEVLLNLASQWMEQATLMRKRLVRHALRTLIKQGHPAALAVMGFEASDHISVKHVQLSAQQVKLGDTLELLAQLHNQSNHIVPVNVDMIIHFIKANGKTSAKVFKVKAFELAANQSVEVIKRLPMKQQTTRQHYPGCHAVELLVNGVVLKVGGFELVVMQP